MIQGKTESFAAFYPRFEKQLADAVDAISHEVAQLNFRMTQNDEMVDVLVPMLRLLRDNPEFVQELHNSGVNVDGPRTTQSRANERASALRGARNPSPDQVPSGKGKRAVTLSQDGTD